MKVLILGVNGFIGSHLVERILEHTDWEVFGMDLAADKLAGCLDHPRMNFLEGDIGISREWIEYHVKKCDVCFPLVAIATPASYVRDPLGVFELDFEENLRIVRQCARYDTRLIFPSTSEVYGMCRDEAFDEQTSELVLGPIWKERWIYSCSKQLLDRVIWAYGRRGLRFSLIRPFNWIGPRLDRLEAPKEGSSRVLTQFIGDLVRNEPLRLVDGGLQRRAFTYIDDGIDALMLLLDAEEQKVNGQIFNLGNPANECTIRELAELVRELYAAQVDEGTPVPPLEDATADNYYGKGYQDITRRRPLIRTAERLLGWQPKVDLRTAVERTLAAALEEVRSQGGIDLQPARRRGAEDSPTPGPQRGESSTKKAR